MARVLKGTGSFRTIHIPTERARDAFTLIGIDRTASVSSSSRLYVQAFLREKIEMSAQ
jgi:hypothetical protein